MLIATNLSNSTLEMLVSPVMTVAVPAIYLAVFICSTPFNLMSLVALLSIHFKRPTSTSVLAINLSLADLIYSAFLPLQVLYHLGGNDWPWGVTLCGITTTALHCNTYCSALITCAIAFERYCGVVRPLRTKHWCTVRRASITCVLIWAFVLITQYPFVWHDLTLRISELDITTCYDVIPRNVFPSARGAYLYFLFVIVTFYLLPLAVLVGCYAAVARELRMSPLLKANSSVSEREILSRRRSQTTVMLTTLCFVVCYLPTFILYTLHIIFHAWGWSLYVYYALALSINSFNCCFDPFVYYFASSEFRQALRSRFAWCCPLTNDSGSTELVFRTSVRDRTG
ncbi:hypothetical protein DPEC_G00152980 [Dallia pectoralis]|uniref:Uncharacterized protein n=1 Tax=Dallia pectoralis TaxID=75939 RepID=A0ACC2GJQ2_DALPE|nr:hypothetical protein DPEC_G00152980 [Dallia pectoralis]